MEMTQKREAQILEGAIKKWGPEAQIVIAMEEMAELTKALTKYLRYGEISPVMENLKSEMADVSIMLNQLELIFGPPDDEEIEKLERLERRLQDD